MRWRLAAVLVGFTALVLLVQNIPLASYLRTVERERIVTGLQRDAFTLAGYSVAALAVPDPVPSPNLDERVDAYSASTGARVIVVDPAGIAIASSEGRDGESYENRPEVTAALGGAAVSGERPSQTLGQGLIYVAVPVRAGSKILGAVRLTYPSSELNATVDARVRGLGAAALITLLSAGIIALLVASTVTRRIRRLRDAAERIAEGDLDARADVSGGGEIEELAESFNTMADRVQAVVESQRGFAGDASHQLRTPLTALRLRLDRAADLMAEDEPAMGQVDAARDEIDRLQRLVDGLLVLARADRRDQHAVPVDVSAVAADRVADWQALAGERQVRIELDTPGMAVALAVPGAVEQIVDNYVDNALEVVPEGSRILVSVRADPSGVVLTVDDQGPGLPAEARDRAFDRFWRGSQDGSGSGLGLAIVSALAQASGGSVWLEASPRGGLRAAARFRTQPAAPHPREASGRHR
ncbi:MAG: ATP-binding protein [Actinomycetales bacterium]|nr:ATP-binding protein [Actinomycetales bacterium]